MKKLFFHFFPPILLLFLSLFSLFPSKRFFGDLSANLTLQYLFFSIIFCIIAIFIKHYKIIPLLVLSILFLTWSLYNTHVKPLRDKESASAQSESREGLPLKVFQINSLVTNTRGALDFSSYIEKNDFDIVVIFEMNNYWEIALSSLKKSYPYSFFYTEGLKYAHFGLITKIKFNKMTTIETRTGMPFFYLNMDLGSKNYNFYFLHPHSPTFLSSFDKRNAYMEDFLRYFKIADNTVVLGDMNNTLFSAYSKDFIKKTKLFPINASNIFLLTWPSALPLFGIDQIYISSGISYQDIRLGPSFNSDHKSLETTLLISD